MSDVTCSDVAMGIIRRYAYELQNAPGTDHHRAALANLVGYIAMLEGGDSEDGGTPSAPHSCLHCGGKGFAPESPSPLLPEGA